MKRHSYRWDQGLRVRVLGLLVFLLALMVGLGVLLSATYSRVEELQQQADRTRHKVLLMEQGTGVFTEMIASVRGYLLTGHENYLQPYASAQANMVYILSELRSASGNDAAQMARIHQVSELVSNYQKQVADPEIKAKREGVPDAGSLISMGTGLNYIEEIRKAADLYIETETNHLNTDLASASAAARQVQQFIWTGVGLAALLALTGFWIFARSFTHATGALAAAAEAISQGERGVIFPSSLDGELMEVAEAFTAMSTTLAAQEEELQAQQEELIAQNEQLMLQQGELEKRTEALEEQDRRTLRLNELGQAMIGTLESDALSTIILDEYLNLYGGTCGVLLVSEPQSEQLVVQAERWLSPKWRGLRVRPTGPLARCMEQKRPVVARYPEAVTRIQIWDQEIPAAQETYIPLIHSNRVIAVAVVASTEQTAPSPDAEALWSPVARQAAIALTAALSHTEVRRGLQALQDQAAQVEELNAQLEEERDRTSAQLDIYLSIVSTMRSGAWLTDTGGNLLVVNETFREFFGDLDEGASLEAVLGRLGGLMVSGDSFLAHARYLVQSRDEVGEGTVQLQDGYVLQWSSAPVGQGNDLVGRLFTFQDVTELTKLDRLKSEFVSTVSHELRTPLTSIIGYLSLVMNEQVGPLEPQQKEFLTVVRRNTDRLANLINDLLDIQRIESGRIPLQCKPVQLADVVRHVAETFRVQAEQKGLSFEVDAPADGLPLISADPDRLTQIAANLVSNAVKYTQTGSVHVKVGCTGSDVYLTVEDTGIGVPPAEQKKIFEKFFRGGDRYAREAGGTGLGLSIVKILVEEHGGQVKLESQAGKGSRFTVTFPLVMDAPLHT